MQVRVVQTQAWASRARARCRDRVGPARRATQRRTRGWAGSRIPSIDAEMHGRGELNIIVTADAMLTGAPSDTSIAPNTRATRISCFRGPHPGESESVACRPLLIPGVDLVAQTGSWNSSNTFCFASSSCLGQDSSSNRMCSHSRAWRYSSNTDPLPSCRPYRRSFVPADEPENLARKGMVTAWALGRTLRD
jgi:hypothetical protein